MSTVTERACAAGLAIVFSVLSAQAQERVPGAACCARWDNAASEAIVNFVQSRQDLDVRQISDTIARLRQARRTCQLGWLGHGCDAYRTIAASMSEAADSGLQSEFDCPPALTN